MAALLPTPRAALLLAAGTLPALASALVPGLVWVALGLDLLVLAACAFDALRAPGDVGLSRQVQPVVSAGQASTVELTLSNPGRRRSVVELADDPPLEARALQRRFKVTLPPGTTTTRSYRFEPLVRGKLRFGDLHLRVRGPWGLGARQVRLAAGHEVRSYPDLRVLAGDALLLARPAETGLLRARRALGEGRDFESLRPYVKGDDFRSIDWKATARRGSPVARHFQPERNQMVFVVLDAGRLMTARVSGRTRLDHAIDATVRLGSLALDRGDQVGALAAGAQVRALVAPGRGQAQKRALVEGLYAVQPALEETDFGAAFDRLQARVRRRALVIVFTDLTDEDGSALLLARVAALLPRHLPVVVACEDADLERAARIIPDAPEEAYRRAAASRVVRDREVIRARLLAAGARVASAPADGLSAAAINQYLEVKARGLL